MPPKQNTSKKPVVAANNNNQPLFYNKPVPLMLDKHAEAGLTSEVNYLFTKATNSVPINAQEFGEVAKTYPIVFSGNALAEPVAVLGIENKKNLFVNSDGDWSKDKYIPAYIRRYPFAFLLQGDKLILCVDESAGNFVKKVKKKDKKFFEGKEQSKTTKFVLDFCLQFHKDQLSTQKFAKEIKAMGLLKPQQVTAKFKDKKDPKTLGGFLIIDEKKLSELDGETLKQLNRKGYLALIYFHLLSLSNFNRFQNLIKN